MKRKVISLLVMLCAMFTYAQSVSYSYRPLAAEGFYVKYTANWQEGKPYLIVSVRSDRMKFVVEPVVLLKTTDGETIRLEGAPPRYFIAKYRNHFWKFNYSYSGIQCNCSVLYYS